MTTSTQEITDQVKKIAAVAERGLSNANDVLPSSMRLLEAIQALRLVIHMLELLTERLSAEPSLPADKEDTHG